MSSSEATCALPPAPPTPSIVHIRVSINALDYSRSSVAFEFQEPPSLLSVEPSQMFSAPGRALTITVRGSGFRGIHGFMCHIGERYAIDTELRFQNSTQLLSHNRIQSPKMPRKTKRVFDLAKKTSLAAKMQCFGAPNGLETKYNVPFLSVMDEKRSTTCPFFTYLSHKTIVQTRYRYLRKQRRNHDFEISLLYKVSCWITCPFILPPLIIFDIFTKSANLYETTIEVFTLVKHTVRCLLFFGELMTLFCISWKLFVCSI